MKTQQSIRCMNYIESIVHLVLSFLILQICNRGTLRLTSFILRETDSIIYSPTAKDILLQILVIQND